MPSRVFFSASSAGLSPSQMRSNAEKNSGYLIVSPSGLPFSSTEEPTPGT